MPDLIVLLKRFLRSLEFSSCGIGADASLSIRSTRLSHVSEMWCLAFTEFQINPFLCFPGEVMFLKRQPMFLPAVRGWESLTLTLV